ncbi:DNA-binding protein WhiA [Aquiluna sp.]|nr:DNA-binding protein WhiA [Aquiluna sp.]MDA8552065.1 DNA-binding protein WhiA [Aquiluna sp.]MDA8719035.1 DNA-binding protein WhiA [Aquiluna sp.]MDA8796359.1 DNA-binding protein WhiA [Aquiluna sp.]NCV81203.1 DNA-binding protein WhiA [Actinomycetota bacterium]
MALTAAIKDELARVPAGNSLVRAAELATILRFCGGLHLISGRIAIEVELDSATLARRLTRAIAELYGIQAELSVVSASGLRKNSGYQIRVLRDGELLARQTGLIDNRGRPVRGLPATLVSSTMDEARAIWRGAFLAHGTLTDPGRSTSLEVTAPGNESAMALVGVARRLGVNAKAREVRNVFRVVVRDGEGITELLRQMGCIDQVDKWEELRNRREVRGAANRLANFDDANLRRSAQAAVAASARVQRALEILGTDAPEHLKYAGELRLKHKDASLDELGRLAEPPMTKDAVAGRIRRLLATADRRAADLGIPDTESVIADLLEE